MNYLASNSLQHQILSPNRGCNNSKTFIDNILGNISIPLVKTAISGNISFSIPDHFPQFLYCRIFFQNLLQVNVTLCPNNQLFLENVQKVNWNQIFQINQSNINLTFRNFLDTMNTFVKSHAPLRKLNEYKESFNKNHGLHKVWKIHKKNQLFKKYIRYTNEDNKIALYNEYEAYRNNLSKLMKQSKKR